MDPLVLLFFLYLIKVEILMWLVQYFTNISDGTVNVLVLVAIIMFENPDADTPPGPRRIPFLGNLHKMGEFPHRTLEAWRQTYGPVIWLKMGSIRSMVVLNAASAKELFRRHDLALAGRAANHANTTLDFSQAAMGWSNYGGYWRVLRRLCSVQMFRNARVTETAELRSRCRDKMERWLLEGSQRSRAEGGNGEVQVRQYLFLTTFNLVGNMLVSKELENPELGRQFFERMTRLLQLSERKNVSDIFPWLKWMDPAGLKRKMEKELRATLAIVNDFMRPRLEDREAGIVQHVDYLDALLDHQGITRHNINLHLGEMFIAGSEKMSIATEWAFAELMHTPQTFNKLREELDRVVGPTRRVQETDIPNLPYLKAVVKETYRLHPPLPMLLPRKTGQDIEYLGYTIPKGTQVSVNVWAVGRDPDSWEDPLVFNPDRFLGSRVNYKGQHFNLIPFGSGRRMCPGLRLAERMVPLAIATLIHSFDWELGHGMNPEDIDKAELLATTLRMKNPLSVIPRWRLHCQPA